MELYLSEVIICIPVDYSLKLYGEETTLSRLFSPSTYFALGAADGLDVEIDF
jgi:hypothetical protein